jgi:hypothetical protein
MSKEEASALAESLELPAGPLSHTQIDTYLRCQRQYYLRYIAHVEGRFSLIMSLGSALHTGLEVLHKGLLSDTGERTHSSISRHLESGLQALRSFMDTILRNDSIQRSALETVDKQGKCLEELLKLWSCDYIPTLDIIGAEEKFYTLINDIPVNVRIDLLRKSRVSDFKVSKKDKTERDALNSLQLAIYAIATELDETSFITLRFPNGEKLHKWTPSIEEISVAKKSSDKEWAAEIIQAVAKSLGTKADKTPEYFPPCNPAEWLCSEDYCDFYSKCRGFTGKKVIMPSWIDNVIVGKGWKPK